MDQSHQTEAEKSLDTSRASHHSQHSNYNSARNTPHKTNSARNTPHKTNTRPHSSSLNDSMAGLRVGRLSDAAERISDAETRITEAANRISDAASIISDAASRMSDHSLDGVAAADLAANLSQISQHDKSVNDK